MGTLSRGYVACLALVVILRWRVLRTAAPLFHRHCARSAVRSPSLVIFSLSNAHRSSLGRRNSSHDQTGKNRLRRRCVRAAGMRVLLDSGSSSCKSAPCRLCRNCVENGRIHSTIYSLLLGIDLAWSTRCDLEFLPKSPARVAIACLRVSFLFAFTSELLSAFSNESQDNRSRTRMKRENMKTAKTRRIMTKTRKRRKISPLAQLDNARQA